MNIPIFQLSPAERALALAVSADPELANSAATEYLDLLGDDAAFTFAKEHEVAAHVAHALQTSSNAPSFPKHWSDEHELWDHRLRAYLTELDRVAEVLHSESIPLIALKNAGIARGLHPCPGCCPMGDIDALVARSNFRKAHEILLQIGYQFEFRSPLEEEELDAAEAGGGAEYRTQLANGETLWFELQWRPVAGRWIQPEQEPKAEDLIARSRPIAGSAARLLAPEDNLLQVALHTAKHSYVRAPGFRLHTDVDRIVRQQTVDWDQFTVLAERLNVRTATYFSLEIARQICQTPIPDEVCQRLAPRATQRRRIERLLNQAGLFHPNQPKFSRWSYIRFTSLLYDNWQGLWQAIVPRRQSMEERYGPHNFWQLPWLHVRRVADLLFRRLST